MITGLGWFWYIRGYWIEGTDGRSPPSTCPLQSPTWSGRERSPPFPSSPSGGDRRLGGASRRGGAGARPQARGPGTDCLLDDDLRLACIALGHYEREFALGEEAYQMATEAGATLVAASSQLLMGRAASMMGDFEGSIEHQRVSEQLFASIGATWGWRPPSSAGRMALSGWAGSTRPRTCWRGRWRRPAPSAPRRVGAVAARVHRPGARGRRGGEAQLSAGWEDIRSRRDWGGALAVGIVAQFLALVGRQEGRALLEGLLEMAEESADPNAQGSTRRAGLVRGALRRRGRGGSACHPGLELQGGRADHRGVFNGLIAAALILQASGEVAEAANLAAGGTAVLAAGGLPSGRSSEPCSARSPRPIPTRPSPPTPPPPPGLASKRWRHTWPVDPEPTAPCQYRRLTQEPD